MSLMSRTTEAARRGARFPLLNAALLAAAFALAQPAFAQDGAPDTDPFRIDTVARWDEAVEVLRRTATIRIETSDKAEPDVRGRTPGQDWKDWVLTPETEARLDALREKVRAQAVASDHSGVAATMREAGPLVEKEAYKSTVLTNYWYVQSVLQHHRKIITPLLEHAPPDRAKSLRELMNTTEQQLADNLAPAIAAQPFEAGGEALLKLLAAKSEAARKYNTERVALMEQAAASGEKPIALKSRTRQSPCPAPAAGTSENERPKLGSSTVSLEDVYPALAKRDEVEGPVVVRVEVSAAGCMEKAEIVTSSGAEELDEAALLLAELYNYVPGVKGGKPVGGSLSFKIQFRLDG